MPEEEAGAPGRMAGPGADMKARRAGEAGCALRASGRARRGEVAVEVVARRRRSPFALERRLGLIHAQPSRASARPLQIQSVHGMGGGGIWSGLHTQLTLVLDDGWESDSLSRSRGVAANRQRLHDYRLFLAAASRASRRTRMSPSALRPV